MRDLRSMLALDIDEFVQEWKAIHARLISGEDLDDDYEGLGPRFIAAMTGLSTESIKEVVAAYTNTRDAAIGRLLAVVEDGVDPSFAFSSVVVDRLRDLHRGAWYAYSLPPAMALKNLRDDKFNVDHDAFIHHAQTQAQAIRRNTIER